MLKTSFDTCLKHAQKVQDVTNFKYWVRNSVRSVFPHEAMVCGYGRKYGFGVTTDFILTVDFPTEYLDSIRNQAGMVDSPVLSHWYQNKKPIFYDPLLNENPFSNQWRENFEAHGLKNLAADGFVDQLNCICTYFSFHRLPCINSLKITKTFGYLIPLMHDIYTRVIHRYMQNIDPIDRNFYFSMREIEIIKYVSFGKSNYDIACLLGLAESTVKNRISRILDKTGCNNRAGLASFLHLNKDNFRQNNLTNDFIFTPLIL